MKTNRHSVLLVIGNIHIVKYFFCFSIEGIVDQWNIKPRTSKTHRNVDHSSYIRCANFNVFIKTLWRVACCWNSITRLHFSASSVLNLFTRKIDQFQSERKFVREHIELSCRSRWHNDIMTPTGSEASTHQPLGEILIFALIEYRFLCAITHLRKRQMGSRQPRWISIWNEWKVAAFFRRSQFSNLFQKVFRTKTSQ